MAVLGELLIEALMALFLDVPPKRPLWLRRLVQAFWIVVAAVVLTAVAYSLVLLAREL